MRFISFLLVFLPMCRATAGYAQQSPDPCLAQFSFRIVVIGSSTAAGTGASVVDSAWVNRYRALQQSIRPANEVINLARGGYNTYHLMPSDLPPPANRPAPDTLRNITRALSFQPDAIVVNLPSNDAAAGYARAEQLANFDTIVQRATAAGVPIWVCTTQPRNFSAAQVQLQRDVRDTILARYAQRAIDFWEGVAGADGWIDPAFNSGDGIHLNDAGHRLLFGRVQDKNIPMAIAPLPQIFASGDTACGPAAVTLRATSLNADTIAWFGLPSGGAALGFGPVWTTPLLDSSATYYAEARRGPFYFENELFTTTSTNRDWNGVMFELTAADTLTLDSIAVKMATAGDQTIVAYTRQGAVYGWENDPAGWTPLDSLPVRVAAAGDVVRLPVGPLGLRAGDTLAIYLHLADPAGQLSYDAVADTLSFSTPELTLRNGTGISYTFAERYYPRVFSGQVYYHFGANPEGACRSARLPVAVRIARPTVDLGPDSLMLVNDTLRLDAGPGFTAYAWSDGSAAQTITLHAGNLQPGPNTVWVAATDSLGCTASDSVLVYVTTVGATDLGIQPQIRLSPNPGQGAFLLWSDPPLPAVAIEVYDTAGRLLLRQTGDLPQRIGGGFGPAGLYWVRLTGAFGEQTIRWVKE